MRKKFIFISVLLLIGTSLFSTSNADLLDLLGLGGDDEPPYCTVQQSTTPSQATCASGTLDDLKNARGFHANDVRPDGLVPTWINIPLARKGQQFAKNYLFSILLSHVFGLLSSGYPDAAYLLMFSGGSDTTPDAQKRYLATITQIFVWYQDTLFGPPTANVDDILVSLAKVRSLHIAVAAAAANRLATVGNLIDPNLYANYQLTTVLSGPYFQDLINSNIPQSMRDPPPSNWLNVTAVPFNQQVAALTQFAFAAYPVLFPGRLGINATDDDIWAFNHLWAVMGYALGVDDKYNVALQPNLQQQRQYYQAIFDTFNLPIQFNMDFNTKALGDITAIAFQSLVSPLPFTPNLILYRFLVDIVQIPAPNVYATLTPEEQATNYGFEFTMLPLLMTNPVWRLTENNLLWTGMVAAGSNLFGVTNYTTRYYRARTVYFAKYN